MPSWTLRIRSLDYVSMYLQSPQFDRDIPLAFGTMLLGRARDCDLVLVSTLSAVSRHHAVIRVQGDAVEIKDLGSRNGTTVNERKLAPNVWTPLRPNDRIELCEYRFVLTEQPSTSPPGSSDSVLVTSPSKSWSVSASRVVTPEAVPPNSPTVEHWRSVLTVAQSLRDILNTDQILARSVESLLAVFPGSERTLIGLFDPEQRFVASEWRQRNSDATSPIVLSQSVIRHVLDTREAICFEDLQSDFPNAESVHALNVRSALCSPLLSMQGEVLGLIQVDADREKFFNANDLEVLVSVATMVSMAINFQRLHQAAVADALIRRDVENAREVQQSFLPSHTPKLERYDLASFYRAARHIGGDYYDFIPLTDGRLALALGDVVNKGVPAALKMVRLASETRACLESLDSPAAVLNRLNQRLAGDWVTMVIGILDPRNNTIMLSSAGHEYPMLCTVDGAITEIGKGQECHPLGVSDEDQFFDIPIELQPGNSLTLFSDGFPDTEGLDGSRFGTPRIRESVIRYADRLNARVFVSDLVEQADQFASDNGQFDDMCLVQVIRKS